MKTSTGKIIKKPASSKLARVLQLKAKYSFNFKIYTAFLIYMMLAEMVIYPTVSSTIISRNYQGFNVLPGECPALQSPPWMDKPSTYLTVEEKVALSPIVVQGRLVSKSRSHNGLYFASFRVTKIFKGHLDKKFQKYIRLMFRDTKIAGSCIFPPTFQSLAGEKYLLFVKMSGIVRLSSIAEPERWSERKETRRAIRKISCPRCAQPPGVSAIQVTRSNHKKGTSAMNVYQPKRVVLIDEGESIKLKCKVPRGNPIPMITWLKDGYEIEAKRSFRARIKTRRRRSTLRLGNVARSDSGRFTCFARNVLGQHSQDVSISIRYSAPEPSTKTCPIKSFCLNGGSCVFFEFIGELVCRCPDGFTGQRCQFKKAHISPLPSLPRGDSVDPCGPYGHDIHLREICAAWRKPSQVIQMTKEDYQNWNKINLQTKEIKRRKVLQAYRNFKRFRP